MRAAAAPPSDTACRALTMASPSASSPLLLISAADLFPMVSTCISQETAVQQERVNSKVCTTQGMHYYFVLSAHREPQTRYDKETDKLE